MKTIIPPSNTTHPRAGAQAGSAPAVTQIFNLLYRRIAFCRPQERSQGIGMSSPPLPANQRHGKLHPNATLPTAALCLLLAALTLPLAPARAATNDLTTAIQRGLFEEEANQNLGAAIQAYQSVASQFDKDRKLAATAIFRLGECYRKQGNTNDASIQYERILREFSDQPTLVTLSRQNLAGLGSAPVAPAAPTLSDAARQEQKRLLEDEIKLVQKQLESQQKQVEVGAMTPDGLLPTQRDLLKLKRQMAALDAGQPISITATELPASAASTESDEVRRIQALIKDSPDLINAPDRKGATLLQSAAAKGNVAVVKLLLENGAAVDGLQQPGFTALHYAAANGRKAVVDLLLSKGAKPDARNVSGVTPLHLATLKGYESVAKALLAAGAPINDLTKDYSKGESEDLPYSIAGYMSPLHLASEGGYTRLVELLLAKGADVNAGYQTPLSYAVRKHYLPVAELLLAAHANPNAGTYDLPLAMAAFAGETPVLKLLLAHGANPNTNTPLSWQLYMGQSFLATGTAVRPLFLAVNRHAAEAVAELLRAKADPNALDPRGQSLLFEALPHTPTLQALLESGANPNVADSEGDSPLFRAVYTTNQLAVELLLAHQADTTAARNSDGWTPLHLAAGLGVKPIAELLLNAGTAINVTNKRGETPLYGAVQHDKPELAALLLARKADPNAKDINGQTPLHFAVSNGQPAMAKLLLANQADPNERNNYGQTPLDLAKSQSQGPRPSPPMAAPLPLVPGSGGRRASFASRSQQREATPQPMAELLRQHGAVDDLPQLDGIRVQRRATGFSNTPLTRGAHDWSQFTLLEVLAMQYGLLATSPNEEGDNALSFLPSFFVNSRLPYPDLAHLRIRRPARDAKSWQEQVVDLTPVLTSGDCSKDARLGWGDVVEVPEADHALNQPWSGLSEAGLLNLKQCLTRQVAIVIKGQATNITLALKINNNTRYAKGRCEITGRTPFWLKPVLLQSKRVLVSSDLSRVKVIRHNAATGRQDEWVVDCSEASPAPDFWLKDGDRIEVPEKTSASAVPAQVLPTPARIDPATGLPTSQSQSGQPFPPPASVQLNQGPQPQSERRNSPSPHAPEAQASQSSALKPAAPSSGPGKPAASSFSQRLAHVVERVPRAETPEGSPGWYLDVGNLRYSPKADDLDLLNAGYHKDRAAKTRRAELWEPRATADLKGRACPAVWTGTDMVVFGGEGMGTSFDDGARYCLAEDTWALLPQKGAPSSRTGHAMLWTGKEVIVWGGFGGRWGNDTNHHDGARYNPSADTWKPVSTRNAPEARFDFSALWTGREMLVWGGYTDSRSRYQGAHADAHLNTGGRYDPASDAWRTITSQGAPSRRAFNTAVWTGKEMLVWGGCNTSKVLNDGGRYNPAKDAWKPINNDGAPSPRGGHVAVWTGKEMLIWGGTTREPREASDYFETGARYNPETDEWKPLSSVGAPKGRVLAPAVWTGTEMIFWGGVNDAQGSGVNDSSRFVGTGARYNPATDTWTEITNAGAPSPRLTSAVWTGDGLLTFGGYNGSHLNDAWFYSPQRTLYPYTKQ
jgi:ankyrin repeat protein